MNYPHKMKIFFLGNNWLGFQALAWLRAQGEEIVGLALPPPDQARYGDELIQASGLPQDRVFTTPLTADGETLQKIQRLGAETGVSVLYRHKLPGELLALFPKRVLNLHPAFLPYNRGNNPNVWPLLDGTPAGTTLHYMDQTIDTGDIVAQKQTQTFPWDTGETLYRRLERDSLELFKSTWPSFRSGNLSLTKQDPHAGTVHKRAELSGYEEIDLEKNYRAQDLLNLLRARTFPPYRGAYFRNGDKKVFIEIKLTPEP